MVTTTETGDVYLGKDNIYGSIIDSLNSWRASFCENWTKSKSVKCKGEKLESARKNYRKADLIKYETPKSRKLYKLLIK